MSYRIKRLIRKRVIAPFLALIAVALLATTSAAPGTSARLQEHDIYYFTDDTYTTQCGYKVYSCERTIVSNGCVTEYYYDEWYDCYSGDHSVAKHR